MSYNGIYRGVVIDNKDPQGLRRLRVSVPQTTGKQVTNWIDPVHATAKPPEIGQGVFVEYLDGDVDWPVWLGSFGKTTSNGPVTALFSCGSFHDETTQSASLNTATAMKFGKTDYSDGVKVVNQTKLTVNYTGLYNVQFSAQLQALSGGGNGTTAYIWLDKNGTSVPNSSTKVTVSNSNPFVVAAWNFHIYLKKNDYCRLMWAVDNTQIKILAETPSIGPKIPSTIVTVNQIS